MSETKHSLPPSRSIRLVGSALLGIVLLAGCERLGIADPAKEAAAREADAKAVGASCRHSGRALEDCYALFPEHVKAQVFAGWKEMNDYMAANNIAVVPPTIPKAPPADGSEKTRDTAAAEEPEKDSGDAKDNAKDSAEPGQNSGSRKGTVKKS